jgi:hypothetical protein
MNNTFQISPRFLPGVKIGDSWLSYDLERSVFWLDTPGWAFEIDGFIFRYRLSAKYCIDTCLSFMLAAAEAQNAVDAGRFSDNADIFSLDIMRWCQENATEIGCVQYELEDYKC